MRRIDFKNIGAVGDLLLPGLLDKIKTAVSNFDKNTATPWQGNLAGNLTHEYYFKDCWDDIEAQALKMAKFHEEQYQCFGLLVTDVKQTNLKLSSMWINFQERYEFNPMHTHDGIYSFVIWLDIPYDMKSEHLSSPGKTANANRSGVFEFAYTNSLGLVVAHPMHIDKNFSGTMCLFPSKLNHMVYPFYSSTGTRVTISGNIKNY